MKKRLLEILFLGWFLLLILAPFLFVYFEDDLAKRLLSRNTHFSALTELKLLSPSDQKKVLPKLIQALKQKDPQIYLRAKKALLQMGSLTTSALISLYLETPSTEKFVQKRAQEIIIKLGNLALPQILSAIDSSPKKALWLLEKLISTHYELDYSKIIATLKKTLNSSVKEQREKAIYLLGEIHCTEPEVIRILNALLQQEPNSKTIPIALGKMGETSVLKELQQILTEATVEKKNFYWKEAAKALIYLREEEKEIIPILLLRLSEAKEPATRAKIVEALRWINATESISQLQQIFLTEKETFVRRHLIRSLRYLGIKRPKVLPTFITALQDKDWLIRKEAAWALGQAKEIAKKEKRAITTLLNLLGDSNHYVGEHATFALIELGVSTEKIFPALLQGLQQKNRSFPQESFSSLSIFQVFQKTLKAPQRTVRRDTARALRWLGKKALPAKKSLIEALKDKDWEVRGEAAWALGNIHAREALSDLLKILEKDSHKHPRENAAWAIGEIGEKTPTIIALLKKCLSETQQDVRYFSAGALFRMGEELPAAFPILLSSVYYHKAYVRLHLALILAKAPKTKATLSTLRRLSFDPDEVVRRIAVQALAAFEKK